MMHLVLASVVLIALIGRRKSKYFFVIACTVLYLVAALRYMYGNDYLNSFTKYLEIRGGDWTAYDELLFVFLNYISPSFYFLVAVTSAVFIWCIYRLITRSLPLEYAWMGLLIFVINPYLFLMNLSAIRQCLAIVCFIAAVHFAIKRRLCPYLLMLAIGVFFHKSAIILLPAWFLTGVKSVQKRLVCTIVLVLLLVMFVLDVDAIVLAVVRLFDDVNYVYYASGGRGNSVRATLLTAISFIYVLGNLPRLKGEYLVYSKLYLVGLIFGIVAYHVSMLTRIQMYFDIFSVVALPAIFQNNLQTGPARIHPDNVLVTLWNIANHYVLPILIFAVYILRYYSFFTNPMWQSFFTYQTIFSAL